MDKDLQGIGMTSSRTRRRLIQRLREQGISNEQVLSAMDSIPRHLFLDEALAHRAYEDTALPIGHQQTLSQPYIVARMTELVLQGGGRRVLELGTGSGYQTAVLARLVDQVFSIERIKPLQDKARERLRALGLNNVQLRHADGHEGWPEQAPFDGILVTAAPAEVPMALLEQLADGGVLVVPVGEIHQVLTQVIRRGNDFETRALEPVRFVPFLDGVVR
ncbi:MAG: protein-L-isoaspartate(D-aspartate) O-methyltransferase [Gammaproteobacteria bacterium]|nr:protein-L-isoaspartate(D-aspartate) O-methyltransferase [Gammaproteobacteria bacterium]